MIYIVKTNIVSLVFTWGSTSMGRCGQTIVSNPRGGDRRICQEPRYVSALKNVVIESIAAGDAHTLALSKNGRVFAWGAGGDGQCGQGHIGNLFSPKRIREIYFENREKNGDQSESEQKLKANVKVESEVAMEEEILSHDLGAISNEKKIVKIRAAGYYSTALSSQGDVYTWGYGGGPAMGHPIPAKQTDVPMLPLIEGNQYSYATSTKTYPVGPGHMVIICSMVGESNDNLAERSSEVINNITNGELDSPHLRDPPLNASVNTESGANTSITSTAEVVSNVSNESMDSSNNTKKGSRLLAKIKSSRSSREVAYPNDAKSPPGVGKEKKKSFRPVGKLIDAALHRNTGK
jgi:alpha-tubulin suppressor-like RCC1 family protein